MKQVKAEFNEIGVYESFAERLRVVDVQLTALVSSSLQRRAALLVEGNEDLDSYQTTQTCFSGQTATMSTKQGCNGRPSLATNTCGASLSDSMGPSSDAVQKLVEWSDLVSGACATAHSVDQETGDITLRDTLHHDRYHTTMFTRPNFASQTLSTKSKIRTVPKGTGKSVKFAAGPGSDQAGSAAKPEPTAASSTVPDDSSPHASVPKSSRAAYARFLKALESRTNLNLDG
ncbi:hypothetical protein Pelo_839 [Pelomyxa schiedti]|nr:hypothetical protein Pelo_839 [Pelomyxa schiedti]